MKTYTINRCRTAPSLDPTPGIPAAGWGKAETAAVDWFHPKSCPIRPTTYFRALYDARRPRYAAAADHVFPITSHDYPQVAADLADFIANL